MLTNLNKSIIFLMIFGILFFEIIGLAYADSLVNENYTDDKGNYLIRKINPKEWRNTLKNYGYGSNLWTINTFSDDSVYDYSKDFWMSIEPWEYQVCSRGLSTQLTDEDGVVATGGGIYSATESVTVAAYKTFTKIGDPFLYEITWYIQPSGAEGFYYTVDVREREHDGLNKFVQESTGAGQRTGSSGYVPFYSTVNYNFVVLKYLGNEKIYPIVQR
jgi:hypothetical protein